MLGGEQSGHVINMLLTGTGDGTLTGIVLLDVMARRQRPLSELAAVMTRLPQVLRNVAFDHPEALNSDAVFWSRVRDIDDELGETVGSSCGCPNRALGRRGSWSRAATSRRRKPPPTASSR